MNYCQFRNETIKRMANAGGATPILPPEYQQVEWLENGGTGRCYLYIDYGVTQGANYHITINFEFVGAPSGAIIGGDTGNSSLYPIYSVNCTSKTIAYSGCDMYLTDMTAGIRYTLDYYYNDGYYGYLNAVQLVTNPPANNTTNNYLCLYYSKYGGYSSPCKIYDVTVRDSYNGTVLYRLIPCYRILDSKPGMYDIAKGTFCDGKLAISNPGTYIVGNNV